MKVTKYRFYWSMTLNSGGLDLTLEDGSNVVFKTAEAGKLVIWVDLLRNDATVFYWKNVDGEGLASGWDQVIDFRDMDEMDESDRYLHDGQA